MLDVAQRPNVTFLAPSPVAVTAKNLGSHQLEQPQHDARDIGRRHLDEHAILFVAREHTKSTSNAGTSISTNTGTLIVIVLGKSK